MNTTGNNSIYNIPFDQYQRYKTASLIVENIRNNNKKFSILEIGANEHKNLERFLPDDNIKYLDIQLPEHLQKDKNYILADATSMPQIEDNKFDIVVALDVFEHIPQSLRNDFLSELNRVSKELVILAGPFNENGVSSTEKKVNQYYKKKYGGDYIWLKEHIENKLPELNITIDYIKNVLKCNISMFSHGSLELWEKLMQLHFEVARDMTLQSYRMNIDNFYNRYLYNFDISKNNYREFLIINKNKNIKLDLWNNTISDAPTDNIEYFNAFIESLYIISQNESLEQKNSNTFSQLFIDQGNGISEESSIRLPVAGNDEVQTFTFDISKYENITNLRLDPLNESCVLEIERLVLVKVDESEVDLTPKISANVCSHHGKSYFFEFFDPQIYFEGLSSEELSGAKSLEMVVRYAHVAKDAVHVCANQIANDKDHKINLLLQEIESKNQEIESKNQEIESKNQEIESKNQEIESKNQEIESKNQAHLLLEDELVRLYSSRSWKITRPMRRLARFLRKYK
ncbi:MAG TPA: hypothetical protein CFH84_09750 [Sulfurimonas sp. UBA12504]|nr:MAG TPA: hypothetical protein CFH84_09750 [Sulfurimonas sp. UBA12504]